MSRRFYDDEPNREESNMIVNGKHGVRALVIASEFVARRRAWKQPVAPKNAMRNLIWLSAGVLLTLASEGAVAQAPGDSCATLDPNAAILSSGLHAQQRLEHRSPQSFGSLTMLYVPPAIETAE